MTKFDKLSGIVMSTPIVEMESPFYLTFDIKINGDVLPGCFVGNFARSLQRIIKTGDLITMRNGMIDNGRVVFDFAHLEPHTAKGRQINIMA